MELQNYGKCGKIKDFQKDMLPSERQLSQAASIRHLVWKTLCKFEPQRWPEILTSLDAKMLVWRFKTSSAVIVSSGGASRSSLHGDASFKVEK